MTTTPLPPPTRSLLVRLTREWAAIVDRPAVLRRAASWNVGVRFRTLDDLVAATGFRLHASSALPAAAAATAESGNEVLARLLLAARHDELAARVVLQRMLPGVFTIGQRWERRCPDADPMGELLAAAWQVIRTYPVERRPHHLASQLLRDAEYHAFVRPRRRLLVHELVPHRSFDRAAASAPAPGDMSDAATELAELVTAARRTGLSARDEELLALLLSGCSTAEIATERGTSVRSVSNHRDALVSRLRQTARVLEAA